MSNRGLAHFGMVSGFMVVTIIGFLLQSVGADDNPVDAKRAASAADALQRMVAAQKSGDLKAYAATLASPVGPVFTRFIDAATKLGQAKQRMIHAMDATFGPGGADNDRFDYAVDESQQRQILKQLVSINIDAMAPNGAQFKMNVTTTIRTPHGNTRQIAQGYAAIEERGTWKVEDMAVVNRLASQRKLAEADWEIFRGFDQVARDVAAGKYSSRRDASGAAREVFDRAIGANVPPPPGQSELARGKSLYDAGDKAGAFAQFLIAAKLGNAVAQCQVAIQYSAGEGVTQDDAQALAWYRKSADQGNPIALNNLGSMLLEGEGAPLNPAEGLRLLRLSADQDHPEAFLNIGRAYLFGLGVPKNTGEGLKWYDQAAALGNEQAAYFADWLTRTAGNQSFKSEKQVQVFQQIQLMRASAFQRELGGPGIDGYYHIADPDGAARIRAEADRLARENGLD